jgi:hypothetical protein
MMININCEYHGDGLVSMGHQPVMKFQLFENPLILRGHGSGTGLARIRSLDFENIRILNDGWMKS